MLLAILDKSRDLYGTSYIVYRLHKIYVLEVLGSWFLFIFPPNLDLNYIKEYTPKHTGPVSIIVSFLGFKQTF